MTQAFAVFSAVHGVFFRAFLFRVVTFPESRRAFFYHRSPIIYRFVHDVFCFAYAAKRGKLVKTHVRSHDFRYIGVFEYVLFYHLFALIVAKVEKYGKNVGMHENFPVGFSVSHGIRIALFILEPEPLEFCFRFFVNCAVSLRFVFISEFFG